MKTASFCSPGHICLVTRLLQWGGLIIVGLVHQRTSQKLWIWFHWHMQNFHPLIVLLLCKISKKDNEAIATALTQGQQLIDQILDKAIFFLEEQKKGGYVKLGDKNLSLISWSYSVIDCFYIMTLSSHIVISQSWLDVRPTLMQCLNCHILNVHAEEVGHNRHYWNLLHISATRT